MSKRIMLFLFTNLMVITTISIITTVLGVNNYLTNNGVNYQSLAIFCAAWGMGGAFISLLMSKWTAIKFMDIKVIHPTQASGQEKYLLDLVHRLAEKAGLKTLPEAGIYISSELNAFATGPSKNNALVAVSTGLLDNMQPEEIEAVLGHEISHVANGDMVTMTLIQGVVNAFSLFLSRIIAYVILNIISSRNDNDESPMVNNSLLYFILITVFDILFSLLGSLVTAAFSRHREYRADNGSAHLTGKNAMINALKRLKLNLDKDDNTAPSLQTLKISRKAGWLGLFSTHPPLEERIARLEQNF